MSTSGKIFSQRCWLEGSLQPATVCFDNGIITRIVPEKIDGAFDAGDDILMPGLIDAHVHINEPGRTQWEGFATATAAAAAGGICSMVDMPLNSSPVTISANTLEQKMQASLNQMTVNVGFYGGLVPGNASELSSLFKAGVLGVKCFLVHSGIDEFPNVSVADLEEAMPLIAEHRQRLLVHAELDQHTASGRLEECPESYQEYLNSRPDNWETEAISMLIGLCRRYHCPTHIVHVSSMHSLPLIQQAKMEGLPLTAETCPHYIYFNAEDIPDGQTVFKCAPPIRSRANNQKLKEALLTGTLDFIATDHSPAPPEIKELESGNLMKAWGGIAGLQLLLPVSWTALRDSVRLDQYIPLLTEKPAAFLKVDGHKGYIRTGFDADLVIWSPGETFRVTDHIIRHRHKACPYTGDTLYGVVKQTIVHGSMVYDGHDIPIKNAGKWLLQK